MKCMEAQQLMKPYLDGKLPDRQTEAFLDHVQECSDCCEELELFLAVHNTLHQAPSSPDWRIPGIQEHMAQTRADIHRRKLKRVAVAILTVLLISLVSALLYINLVLGPDESGEKENDQAPKTEAVSEGVSEAMREGSPEALSEQGSEQQFDAHIDIREI